MEAQLLVSISDVTLEHLVGGESFLIGHGHASLSLLSVAISPSDDNIIDGHLSPASAGPSTSKGPPPPIPPRPISPAPPALPPRVSLATGVNVTPTPPGSSEKGAPPPLPPRSRPSTPPPPPFSATEVLDQYLILQLNDDSTAEPLFECPIPASSRILSSPPASFIIPCCVPEYERFFGASKTPTGKVSNPHGSEEDGDGAGFIKLTLGASTTSDDRELFEHFLWSLASFSSPTESRDLRSKLVLVDETTGVVIGELATGDLSIAEDPHLALEGQGSEHEKEPVVVDLDGVSPYSEGHKSPQGLVTIQPVSAWRPLDNPTNSRLIDWADYVSRGVIVGAETISKGLNMGAESIVTRSNPTETPLVFSPTTKSAVERGHKITSGAVKISAKTVGLIGDFAAHLGDFVGKKTGIQSTPSGKPPKGIRGVINRSLIAFNAVVDAAQIGGTQLLDAGASSSTAVLGHRYGPEAAQLSNQVGGSVKHVALVYIDARGVTRKALLKSVGKHAIRARMADGRQIVLDTNSLTPVGQRAAPPALPARKTEKLD
ncbi:hypothetical protein T439DRAFT_320125 [Meredithblackwellia eburnea MCA 4105]